MGDEHCQLRRNYHRQQTTHVQQWLCFHLWSPPLSHTFIHSLLIYIYIAMHPSQQYYIFFFLSASTLTGFHFAVTALVGILSNATGYSSSSKHVPMWELLWFSMVANLSITAMNFSLMLNSVGFYQVFFFIHQLLSFTFYLYVFCKDRHTPRI